MTLRQVVVMLIMASGYSPGFAIDYAQALEVQNTDWAFNEIRPFREWKNWMREQQRAGN